MALLTFDNVGPMTLRERAKEARRRFRSAIVPVFGAQVQTRRSPRANNLQLVGSGILITIDGDGYLATAAHVIDELDHSPLWIPRENDLWPLSVDIFQTETPSEGRRSDTIDCSWLRLGSTVVAKFGSASFVSENAISFNLANCSKRFYMA